MINIKISSSTSLDIQAARDIWKRSISKTRQDTVEHKKMELTPCPYEMGTSQRQKVL